MRFISGEHEGRPFAGRLVDDRSVLPIAGACEIGAATPAAMLANPRLDTESLSLADVALRPVVPSPMHVVAVGLNYQSHVTESKRPDAAYPALFVKFASSLVAAGDPVARPPESAMMDYEGELAVVIGRTLRRADAADVPDAILGYTVANDITMRDYQYKSHQWLQGKAWDRSTPLGPYLVTPDEFGDVGAHILTTRVNGEVVQHESLSRMIRTPVELIATISTFMALEPGDVVLTGTPGGVGYRRDPQRFLDDGDTVSVEIDGIGTLTTPIVAEQAG